MRPPQPGCAWASSLCGLPRPPRPTLLPYTTLFRSVGLEALDDLARDPLAEQRLDLAEQALLVDADQRDRVAGRPGPARPADAVNVVLGDHGQLEVHDVRQVLDVEAARRDLRCDEDRRPAGLEVIQRLDPLALALVAVDRGRGDAVALELLGEVVGAVLGPGEDEGLLDPAAPNEGAQQLALAMPVDRVDDL